MVISVFCCLVNRIPRYSPQTLRSRLQPLSNKKKFICFTNHNSTLNNMTSLSPISAEKFHSFYYRVFPLFTCITNTNNPYLFPLSFLFLFLHISHVLFTCIASLSYADELSKFSDFIRFSFLFHAVSDHFLSLNIS